MNVKQGLHAYVVDLDPACPSCTCLAEVRGSSVVPLVELEVATHESLLLHNFPVWASGVDRNVPHEEAVVVGFNQCHSQAPLHLPYRKTRNAETPPRSTFSSYTVKTLFLHFPSLSSSHFSISFFDQSSLNDLLSAGVVQHWLASLSEQI